MDRIEELINELEADVLRAKKAPFSSADVLMNKRDTLNIIDRIRAALPDALREAGHIMSERDMIKQEAVEYATATIANAEERAKELVSQDGIIARANEEADRIKREAIAFCREKEAEARYKIDRLLADSEEHLTRAVLTVRENRDDLRK